MKKTTPISPTDPITSLTPSRDICWCCYVASLMLLVSRSFPPSSLSVLHLISIFSSDRHFLISSLSWCTVEKRCVLCISVCVSPAWLCRKTVWMRSQHAADRQHLHCKGLSWLPLIARPCCFHAERGSDWGVVALAGPADVQITKRGWDGLRKRLWWSNQNDKFDSLDEGPQFVEQIAERWHDWMLCGLIL